MDLRIKIADIPPEGLNLDWELPPEPVGAGLDLSGEDTLTAAGPVQVRLHVEKSGSRLVVRGTVSGVFSVECSRCLEPFDIDVAEEVLTVLTPREERVIKERISVEDLDEDFYQGEEIDLWPIVREHFILGIPAKRVCKETCLGLCPQCGANRNLAPCDCSLEAPHPGLAALKALKDRLPK